MQSLSTQSSPSQTRLDIVRKASKDLARFSAQEYQIVKPSEVPAYLRRSYFYRSLTLEGDNEFVIPFQHMKPNAAVKTVRDLEYLLRTIRFWGTDGVPTALIVYLVGLSLITEECEDVLREFAPDLKYLHSLLPFQR